MNFEMNFIGKIQFLIIIYVPDHTGGPGIFDCVVTLMVVALVAVVDMEFPGFVVVFAVVADVGELICNYFKKI